MSSTTTTTSTTVTNKSSSTSSSTRAVHVEQIQDENILREMWMGAEDGESKRQIRSRMYKLREDRLKDFYGREGVLDSILSPTPGKDEIMCRVGEKKMIMSTTNKNGNVHENGVAVAATKKKSEVKMMTMNGKSGGSVQHQSSTTTTTVMKDVSYQNNKKGATARRTIVSETTSGGKGGKMTTTTTKVTATRESGKTPKITITEIKEKESSPPPPVVVVKSSQPRFMAATKSSEMGRQSAIAANTRIESATTTVSKALVTKTKSRETSPPNRIESTTVSKTMVTKMNSAPKSGNKSREMSPTNSKTSVTKTQSSKSTKSRETSPKGRAGSTPVPSPAKAPAQGKSKDKEEESIIRELDILDTFLSQRSTSVEEPAIVKQNGSTTTKATATAAATSKVSKKSEMVDVMESGVEPPFVKKVYKYECPGDDSRSDRKSIVEKVSKTNANTTATKSSSSSMRKSNIEDEIIPDTFENLNEEKKRGSLSHASAKTPHTSAAPVKSNLNESQSQTTTTTTKMKGRVSQSQTASMSTSSRSETLSKQEKYEADILSRPSVFDKKSRSRPEPNPRVRGGSDSSPERGEITHHKIVKKDAAIYVEEDDDNEDDPLKPQTRFGGQGSKGLESPGAVLKAKSLFENKATEAAMDKSSGGFTPSSPSFKVTKNAAIFEARSRGERVSISSESSSHPTEDKEISTPQAQATVAATEVITSNFERKSSEDRTKRTTRQNSGEATTKKATRQNSGDVEISKKQKPTRQNSGDKNTARKNSGEILTKSLRNRKTSGDTSKVKTSRQNSSDISHTKSTKSKSEDISTKTTLTKTMSSPIKHEEKAKVEDKQGSEENRKKKVVTTRSNSSVLEAKVNAMENRSNKSATTTSQSTTINTRTLESINVEEIESIEELETLLEKATDYDERSKIRARIRALKRKQTLEKSTEGTEGTKAEKISTAEESTRVVMTISTVKNTGASAKMYTSRKSSDDIQLQKSSRKGSTESAEKIVRRRSSGGTSSAPKKMSGEISKSKSPSKETSPSPSPGAPKNYEQRRRHSSTEQKRKASQDSGKGSRKNSETKEIIKRKNFKKSPSPSPPKEKELSPTPKSPRSSREPSAELYSTRRPSKTAAADETTIIPLVGEPKSSLIPRRSPSPDLKREMNARKASRDKERTLVQKNSIEEFLELEKQSLENTESSSKKIARKFSRDKASPPKSPKIESAEETQPKVSNFSREKLSKTKSRNLEEEVLGGRERELKQSEITMSTQVKKIESGSVATEKRRISDDVVQTEENTNIPPKQQRKISPPRKSSIPDSGKASRKNSEDIAESSTAAKRFAYERRNSSKELKVTQSQSETQAGQEMEKSTRTTKTTTTKTTTATPEKKIGGYTTSVSKFSSSKTTTESASKGQPQGQGTDSVTSSYGIGPTDDNGLPLFGLQALRKIKQVQEEIASSKTTTGLASTITTTEAADDSKSKVEDEKNITSSSLRSSDLYGLRALRKTTPAREESMSTPPPDEGDKTNLLGVEERPGSAPKSILKKTSSFSSNKSDSKTDIDTAGVGVTNTATMTTTTTSTTKVYTNKSGTTSEDKKSTRLSSMSPEPSLSRGRVGRSSVKEMSKKFETPTSAIGGFEDGGLRTKISVVTKSSVTKSMDDDDGFEDDAHARAPYDEDANAHAQDANAEGTHTRTTITTRIHGRSFLTDGSPVTNLSDVLERMKGEEGSGDMGNQEEESGRNLLNKFIGAQILLQGVEPMLLTGSKVTTTTMSQSLVINGVDVEQETDGAKLRQLLDDCVGDAERSRIEMRLKTLSGEERRGSKTMSLSSTKSSSQDVTGELMPLILGQLQNSLHSFSGLGGGKTSGSGAALGLQQHSSVAAAAAAAADSGRRGGGNSESSSSSSSHSNSSGTKDKGEDSNEECLFDSGTESGEDVASCAPAAAKSSGGQGGQNRKKSSPPPPAEFSSFMEGLRNSLARTATAAKIEAAAAPTSGDAAKSSSDAQPQESDLLNQVDSVLSLLRDSLTKDPNFMAPKVTAGTSADPQRGKELIALIDRLKTSLNNKDNCPLLPTLVGQGSETTAAAGHWQESSDKTETENSNSNSNWIVKPQKVEISEDAPWKVRAAKKRAVRSRSIGVSDEELAEARRFLQEEAFRASLKEEKRNTGPGPAPGSLASTFFKELDKRRQSSYDSQPAAAAAPRTWKSDIEKGLTSVPRPFVRASPTLDDPLTRRVSSVDDASFVMGAFKLKPFRTFSLDNSRGSGDGGGGATVAALVGPTATAILAESVNATSYDPSVALFTPEEVVQIEIHKAAIKKQMSAEEDRRRRRNSLTWQPSGSNSGQQTPQSPQANSNKEFLVGLPKPYNKPSSENSGGSNMPITTFGNNQSSGGGKSNRGSSGDQNQDKSGGQGQSQGGSRNDRSIIYDSGSGSPNTTSTITTPASPTNRIENVQISLKEVNSSSEFPQLQIAITLNTNSSGGGLTATASTTTTTTSALTTATNPAAETSSGVQSMSSPDNSDTSSKANRYKTKNERKKKMKRANTIDIPPTPGFLISQGEEETEGDDEGESDCTTPGAGVENLVPPFLDKNIKPGAPPPGPGRPAYLSVNDKQWNSRFYNLKTSFESSSQGSSPSASPLPSPGKGRGQGIGQGHDHVGLGVGAVLKSVHQNEDHYSVKPVWSSAIAEPGHMSRTVKNKLSVFECRDNDPVSATKGPAGMLGRSEHHLQWKSPISATPNPAPPPGPHHFPQPEKSSILSKKDNFEKFAAAPPELQIRKQVATVKPHPLPMQTQEPMAPMLPPKKQQQQLQQQQQQLQQQQDGVHMIHATKSAIEAMQRGSFISPPLVPPRVSHPPQSVTPIRPPPPEKSDLPWAKKEVSVAAEKGSARVQMSKALFESKGTNDPTSPPPPVPPKPNKVFPFENSNYGKKSDYDNFTKIRQKPGSTSPSSPPAHVEHISGIFKPILVPSGQQMHSQVDSQTGRPKLGVFGVTRSFDEQFRQKLETQQQQPGPKIKFGVPVIPAKTFDSGHQQQQQQVKAEPSRLVEARISAFAQKEPGKPGPIIRPQSVPNSPDGLPSPTSTLIAPVLSKVMQGPQQQRATMTRKDISSLGEDHPSAHRISGARSNIRNILSNYEQQGASTGHGHAHSEDEFPSVPGHGGQTTLQLRAKFQQPPPSQPPPALTKSKSGDAIFKSHYNKPPIQFPPMESSKTPIHFGQSGGVIPKQKSFTSFPPQGQGQVLSQFPPKILGHPQPQHLVSYMSSSISTPSIPTTTSTGRHSTSVSASNRSTAFPSADSLQRASSGSSIFDRAQCLYVSTQESGQSALAPKPRRKPPTLPRSNINLFPKQYEAQLSPETVGKKTKEVQAYFQNAPITTPIPPAKKEAPGPSSKLAAVPKQTLQLKLEMPPGMGQKVTAAAAAPQQTSHAIQKYQNKQQQGTRIRKSASHGKIMHRQRSLSDGEEDVDKIFESLFKASISVESRVMGSGDVCGTPEFGSKTSIQSQFERKKMSSSSSFSASTSFSSKTSAMTATTTASKMVQPPSPFNKFKSLDQQNSNSSGGPGGKVTPAFKAGPANNPKDLLLYWCQCRTRDYKNVKLENFSNSWSDGLAFCALIHHFYPDAFDYDTLDSKNRRANFELAFRIAEEKADIYPLLEVEDMMIMGSRPDWKCVFTYVQSMYRKLKDL